MLGPSLFLTYADSFAGGVRSHLHMSADNAKTVKEVRGIRVQHTSLKSNLSRCRIMKTGTGGSTRGSDYHIEREKKLKELKKWTQSHIRIVMRKGNYIEYLRRVSADEPGGFRDVSSFFNPE